MRAQVFQENMVRLGLARQPLQQQLPQALLVGCHGRRSRRSRRGVALSLYSFHLADWLHRLKNKEGPVNGALDFQRRLIFMEIILALL